jgi:hypothetical protein
MGKQRDPILNRAFYDAACAVVDERKAVTKRGGWMKTNLVNNLVLPAFEALYEAYERLLWQPMRSAPRDGTPILVEVTNGSGEPIVGLACWMAPNGDHGLLGWWAAGATKGSLSLQAATGIVVPFKWHHIAITPKRWRRLPAPFTKPKKK